MNKLNPVAEPSSDQPAQVEGLADPMADPNFDMRASPLEGTGFQGTLFPLDELIVPDSVRSIKKAVSAIHVVPVKAEHAQTLNNKRLFDACILVVQTECRGKEAEMARRLREDRISPMFEVRASHLGELANIKGGSTPRIYEELDKLLEMQLSWNIIGEDASVVWEMKSHFFSILGYGKNYKLGMVRFAFDASVLSLFLEPTVWAKLSMADLGRMPTSPSYSLFQNAWRYIGTQNKCTAPMATHTWIELLMGKSWYVKELPDGQRSVNYGEFKRRILLNALRQVNECPALSYTLELKEIKSGNRVAQLQFKFIPKEQRQLAIPLTWPPEVVHILEQIGYTRREIDELSQAYSIEVMCDALTRLSAADKRLKEQGRGVTSRRAYLEGILNKIAGGATDDQLTPEKLDNEIRIQEAKAAADTRKSKLKAEFEQHQRGVFADWFERLDESVRADLVKAFTLSPDLAPGDKILAKKGIGPGNYSVQARLREWMAKERTELLDAALPNPEDKTFEDWVYWQAEIRTSVLGDAAS